MIELENIKRVGSSGQISLGKEHAGRSFREEFRDDGAIVLVPVVVLPVSHWSVRDTQKIKQAISWAKTHSPEETSIDSLVSQSAGKKRVK